MAQYYTSAFTACAGPDSLSVLWSTHEDPGPNQYPAWVGYDVLRRAAGECGWASFVR